MRFGVTIGLLLLVLNGTATAGVSKRVSLTPEVLTEQAQRYLYGEGVASNPDLAVLYLCAAARRGHAPAAYRLGWAYFQGRGVPRDDGLAAAWLREAARLGEPPTEAVMQRLNNAKRRSLECVDGRGRTLTAGDLRRVGILSAVYRLAPEFDLDPKLVVEVIRAESNFDPRARSVKGALGLMQLLPSTAQRFGVSDPYEPVANIRGGMAYLKWLLERFDGDLALSLASYNAGEDVVERIGGIPPYAETRAYVQSILGRYEKVRGSAVDHASRSDWRVLPTAFR